MTSNIAQTNGKSAFPTAQVTSENCCETNSEFLFNSSETYWAKAYDLDPHIPQHGPVSPT